ncbi:hypothetical protein [Paraburkholderia sp. DGU8]|uniref:hypothetical protein n=1 Tax=Paraburkholderia sp. DGU8 TaxID=3161997 RepID=UPI0034673FBE
MDRYGQANVATDPPVTPSENPGGFPANGTPAVGIPGTVPGEWWYQAITEELRNAIVALGASPDFAQTNQLAQSLLSALAHLAISVNYEDLIGKPALAAVATSGAYDDLSGTPPPFELLPATTATLGGVIAGPGTTLAADGTLSALGKVLTVSHQGPDTQGNCTVQAVNTASPGQGQVSLINQGGATSGSIVLKLLQSGRGLALADNLGNIEIDATPATAAAIGAVKPGTGLAVAPDGTLSATPQANADWNATSGPAEILNRPSQLTVLPVLTFEFGNSGQANGGLGIDKGNWYQQDFHIGVTTANGFQYTVNSDGTALFPQGVYLVSGTMKILPVASDNFQEPAQITAATGQTYAFPGVYEYAVQFFPQPQTSINTLSGPIGSVFFSGAMANWSASVPIWLGFSKVQGTVHGNPLQLQGFLSYVKVG